MLRFCAIVLGIVTALLAADVGAQNADDPRVWTDSFLEVLCNKSEDHAVRILKEETFLGQQLPGSIGALSDQMKQMKVMAGTTMNYEFVDQRNLGSRLIRLSYVVNSTRLPVVWNVIMYNAQHGWQVIGIQFQANTTEFVFD